MIALFLVLQAAAAASPAPLLPDALPRQELPVKGCAAYLFSTADRRLVAMAGADPASLRLSLGGRTEDLPRVAESGAGGFGFASTTRYRTQAVDATLAMTIVPRADLADGAVVTEATLSIARDGADMLVLPVGGLVGCRPSR